MHNPISYNQLAGWKESIKRLEKTLDTSMEESDLINDYYDCLIEGATMIRHHVKEFVGGF